MIRMERLRVGRTAQGRTAWFPPVSFTSLERHAPLLVALAVGAGVLLLVVTTSPANSDSGQWLMASRFYLGQQVPDYRTISALPPLVPMLLAAIQVLIPDPIVALHLLNAVLIAGLAISFYLLGSLVLDSRWAGALSLVIGLVASDRFLELFAFGGLLQVAAMIFMGVSIAAFARAGRGPDIVRRWWLIGTAAVGCAAMSHTATGVLAIAAGVVAAGLAAARQRHVNWKALAGAIAPLGIVLAGIGIYWGLVLLPANADYLSNPASLAYRGPDRLFSPLIGQWPSVLLLSLGTLGLAVGGVRALLRRRLDGYTVLIAWVAVIWGALISSMTGAAGTDYPRFATPMLAPLVVGAAAVGARLLRSLASSLRNLMPRWSPDVVMGVVVLAAVLVTAPIVAARHTQQADFYDLRDATALRTAVTWMDEHLGTSKAAVLTDVREGKWVEGLSGREALFSQPVRYAFRRVEWQRSVDADALLRSTVALTTGLIGALFTDTVVYDGRNAPTGLLIRANHGGELLDLLRLSSSTIMTHKGPIAANRLVPVRVVESVAERQVSLSSVWADRHRPVSLTQSVTVWRDGSSLRLSQQSPGHRIRMVLRPVGGISIVSFVSLGQEATVCFTEFGDTRPCLRIWVSQPDATLSHGADGALRVRTSRPEPLDLLVTAISAGGPSVALGVLHPQDLIETRNVGAALLYAPDPAYDERLHRLEGLGFSEAFASGPYRVLLREQGSVR
jgi:hypothetical protein